MKKGNTARLYRCEEELRRASLFSVDEVLAYRRSSEDGLSTLEAKNRLLKDGYNILPGKEETGRLKRLREAIINPFNMILLVIGAVTFFTDVIMSPVKDYVTFLIILLMIGSSSLVSFRQSIRSDDALASLKNMVTNTATVLRDGNPVEIPMEEVVSGDVVKLSAGDMLPCDLRFIRTKDLFLSQAALTGESLPVEKFAKGQDSEKNLMELPNIGLMGCDLISGSALAVVIFTGSDTYLASVADSLTGDRAKTAFERGVESVSSLLIRMMLLMVPAIFLINGLMKGNWGTALLFAASVSVGLTPEMLPVIQTSTLAQGARILAKKKVIVRTLGAIQTLGEMDILCTDKTGTLTEDRIVLEKYMNVRGEDDLRILRHAFLNSYFQTGLKNLIDLAIIHRAEAKGLMARTAMYHAVDEIPFDFTRRRMSVILEDTNGKRQLIAKGAVEEMLAVCDFVELEGEALPLDEGMRKRALAITHEEGKKGLRMLAVAQKNAIQSEKNFSTEDEDALVLIGFVGFLDPPKESAKAALRALEDAGVQTVVLTGDSAGVAHNVCAKLNISTQGALTGEEILDLDDEQLAKICQKTKVFSKLTPMQKKRLIETYQKLGHTVGYMGDGINDTPAMRQSDVGISVDSAVDIAKETADLILLEKDLMVLEEGVVTGRRTFGNIMKYIMMATSGNFGNIFSMLLAGIFLPFLPMLPVQMLTQNLLCDFAQIGMATDRVDEEYLQRPQRWDTKSIERFMLAMGLLSSVFDLVIFAVMYFGFAWNTPEKAAFFHGGWFVFGSASQILIIHMIRTLRRPFIDRRSSGMLAFTTGSVLLLTFLIAFTPMANALDMARLPHVFLPVLFLVILLYALSVQLFKNLYYRRYKVWIGSEQK